MKIYYRSVPIVSTLSVPQGSVSHVTTLYDMANTRSHILEISLTRLTVGSKTFWIGWLIWFALVFALCNMRPWLPVLVYGLSAAGLAFILWGAFGLAEEAAMEEYARKERSLPADKQLKVVKLKEWDQFAEKLR